MASTYKRLGAIAPSATSETDIYNTPAATSAVISSITVCNRDAAAATFRLSLSPEGSATVSADYLAYDASISGNDTIAFTLGVSVQADWDLRAYASSANLTFQAFGVELT
jgi:hypothetical protein